MDQQQPVEHLSIAEQNEWWSMAWDRTNLPRGISFRAKEAHLAIYGLQGVHKLLSTDQQHRDTVESDLGTAYKPLSPNQRWQLHAAQAVLLRTAFDCLERILDVATTQQPEVPHEH